MDTHVVIMAGGVGSRLWPVSTPDMPKQFMDLLGTGKTLIQMTVERFLPVCPLTNFWIVTSGKYTDIVKNQLPDIPDDHILAEPEARNTAPCIAYACWKIAVRHPDANIVVTPSDAYVTDTGRFSRVISESLGFILTRDAIVTVGIRPTRPETGYGYICAEKGKGIVKVERFREKPDLATAQSYLQAGNYYWNAGIFVWSVSTIISQMKLYCPGIADIMDSISGTFYTADEQKALAVHFPSCEKVSIDYAVMEKSDRIYVYPEELGWSDLGSWGALRSLVPQDGQGNAVIGNGIRLVGCSGCIVHVTDGARTVVEGLKDCIVAARGGNIIVCGLSNEQQIKEYSK